MSIYSEDIARYIWRNGEIIPWEEATVHVNSVGHASVAGVFEGIKAYWNDDEGQLYVFRPMVRDGKLVTPPITSNILESVTRDTVIHIAQEILNIPVEERVIDRTELYMADELFFLGTGWEIMPVASVDRLPVGDGKPGPTTQAIREAYQKIVRGIDKRYPEWRTPVW